MLIECVPNVSEGRRANVVEAMARAIESIPGVRLLDRSADPAHNRAVFTFVGEPDPIAAAALALAARAVADIDLRRHEGVHPRIGALDVLPFVPLGATPMSACIDLARRAGAEIARQWALPVYLYEEAASSPERRRLEAIRKGGVDGLAARMHDAAWWPDFGPHTLHPTAGACAVGARKILVAFNVNLRTEDLGVARAIAAHIRERDGGLPAVKALGLPLADRGLVQVSINLTDFERTSMGQVFQAVAHQAARRGVEVAYSEVVGLVPGAALGGTSPEDLKIAGWSDGRLLERRLGA
jgi:glutamate formiminotransferase/formiminotetrahydrofolate cyclodeaminase